MIRPALTAALTIAAAALTLPVAAIAAPKPEASAEAPPSTRVALLPRRYCFVDKVTGSLIERRTCKTLEDWLAEGIDPRSAK